MNHHTNHHNKKHHKNHESSSSFSPSRHRYHKYQMNGGELSNDDDFDQMYEDKYLKYKQKYLDLKDDN